MQKCLYLVCPTDCLEAVINDQFKKENYFYTSLGNSFNPNRKTLNCIRIVVQKHDIRKICFVLANDNKIINDAFTNQNFSNIKGLRSFYTDIFKHRKKIINLSVRSNNLFPVVSEYLNKKTQELQTELYILLGYTIEISGKIYDRNNNTFNPIYSNLVCLKKHQLN